MKYFSEKTKKFYENAEDCVAAETAFDEEQARIAAEQKALAESRKERAKEVEDAYKMAEDWRRKYLELRNAFVKDFGSFHMTIRNSDVPTGFEDLFRFFF
jgi:hypothetical protein